CARASYFDVW
nr:immunoglobulin heavy chain junction region [Mus musculus]